MGSKMILGAAACAVIALTVGVSRAATAPVQLLLPQSIAFKALGASCGGIQERSYATGFDATTGYPTGDVFLSTRCGGSGRGGGYRTTTHSAWVAVTWTFTGAVDSYQRIAAAPQVDPSLVAYDAAGNEVYNASNNAYLELAPAA